MFKSILQRSNLRQVSSSSLSNLSPIPKYVLATLRSFPSLEPKSFFPVDRLFLNSPLRRDILWKASVFEADASRVGSSNPPGRSEKGYSRKKLLPQKGQGRARVGDRGSPIRHEGGRALARTAPNDYTTELPYKVYSSAFRTALSHQWRQGKLFIIGGEQPVEEYESNITEFVSDDSIAASQFLQKHNLLKKKLLFIVDQPRPNLQKALEPFDYIDIISKEFLEVRDVLRALAVFVEMDALKYLANKYGE